MNVNVLAMAAMMSASLVAASSAAAPRELSCDFSQGIPSDFILVDADGNELSTDVRKFGFSQGDAWVPFLIAEEDNAVASSTSWYANPGTSSDWMILPPLEVADGASLSWRAKAVDRRFRDGYAVYVSDASAVTPDAFLSSAPLFLVTAEEAEWTTHDISLDAYAGREVRIAFVNNSTDCSRLFIDDISAGTLSGLGLELTMPYLVQVNRPLTVSGWIINRTGSFIDSYSLTLDAGGNEYTETFRSGVAPGERVRVDWKTDYVPLSKGEREFIVTARAGESVSAKEQICRAVSRKIFLEEGTGTWCGWCVRGIVAMREAYARYPEEFAAIAIHSNDRMETDSYTVDDIFGSTGLPVGILNRDRRIDPNPDLVLVNLEQMLSTDIHGALDISTKYNAADGRVSVDAEVWMESFYNDGDYRIVCLVKENDVRNDAYRQSNAYSGGANGPMGGFEEMPDPIPGSEMVFPDVARGALTPVSGEPGSLPASMRRGETARWHGEFSLPSDVDNPSNVMIVVALLDGRTGNVINVEEVTLNGNSGVDGLTDGFVSDFMPVKDAPCYDMTGRRLLHPVPGTMCIRAGRKFIVR